MAAMDESALRKAERQLRNTLFCVEVGSKRLGVKEWK
jgi:hypothetical protein